MDSEAIKKLDVHSLLNRNRASEDKQFVPPQDPEEIPGKQVRDTPFEIVEVEQIDDLTKNFGNPHSSKNIVKQDVQEQTINEILDKYNKKYNLDLQYANFQDALNLATEGDKVKSELMQAVVSNSILGLVDFTNFSLIILACKQIQGLVTEMLEGDELGPEDKVVLLDRIFLWISRLQGLKMMYSPTDIDHIVKRMEQSKLRSGGNGSKLAINKILDILKLGKKTE